MRGTQSSCYASEHRGQWGIGEEDTQRSWPVDEGRMEAYRAPAMNCRGKNKGCAGIMGSFSQRIYTPLLELRGHMLHCIPPFSPQTPHVSLLLTCKTVADPWVFRTLGTGHSPKGEGAEGRTLLWQEGFRLT